MAGPAGGARRRGRNRLQRRPPTRVPVSGRVLVDGQPLAAGMIRFHPSAAPAGVGQNRRGWDVQVVDVRNRRWLRRGPAPGFRRRI